MPLFRKSLPVLLLSALGLFPPLDHSPTKAALCGPASEFLQVRTLSHETHGLIGHGSDAGDQVGTPPPLVDQVRRAIVGNVLLFSRVQQRVARPARLGKLLFTVSEPLKEELP